ncbi:MAG: type II CAAX endopeptidase family protein [Opitutus sp.]
MPATPVNIAVTVFEVVLLLLGVILLARLVLSRSARAAARGNQALAPWSVSVSDFLLFAFLMVAGGLFSAFLSGLILARFSLPPDTKTILNSAVFQLGLLIGPAVLPLNLSHRPLVPPFLSNVFRSGAATFLIALPIVSLVNLAWQALLDLCGLPAEQQDLLRMFSQATEPALIGVMIVLATVIAPITEELLFRATLFRYLRTRVPRWIALLVPGVVFAALHVNWSNLDGLASFLPLVTLAAVFSLAFERTGRIGTAMVAHGLFNLHTIMLVLLGVTT